MNNFNSFNNVFKNEIKIQIKNKNVIIYFCKYVILLFILNLIGEQIRSSSFAILASNYEYFTQNLGYIVSYSIIFIFNILLFPITLSVIRNIINNNYKKTRFLYYYKSIRRFRKSIKIYLSMLLFTLTIVAIYCFLLFLLSPIQSLFYKYAYIPIIAVCILIASLIISFQWIFYVMNLKYGGKIFNNFKNSLKILKKNFKSLLFLNLSFLGWFLIPVLAIIYTKYGGFDFIAYIAPYPLMVGVGFWVIPYYFTTLVKYSEMIIEKYKA